MSTKNLTLNNIIKIADEQIHNLKFNFPYTAIDWVNKGMPMENQHKHTTWSNLMQMDSATSIGDFLKKSSELGCKCYFSGEHGYPGEWLMCYDICKNTKNEKFRDKIGIDNEFKFIYSAEVYWVKDRLAEHEEEYEVRTGKDKGQIKTRTTKDRTNCHMVLIARTYKGIRMLNYIISEAHEHGFYFKPRIDLDLLFQLSPEDVYVCSACVAGWKYEDAAEIWYRIWKHFGDSFFLEYQTHNTDKQKDLNQIILLMSKEFGIQTIIGLDTHYIDEKDCIKRDNLLKRKGIHYDDEDGWYMDFPSGTTVLHRMLEQGVVPIEDIIVSMLNTHVFTSSCDEIVIDTDFKIPILDEYKTLSYEDRSNKLLEILNSSFEREPKEYQTQDRRDGIDYEFSEIKGSGTSDYFLTNNKLIETAINEFGGQLTTTSRGSASSYYCSKLLGFTTIDRFDVEVPIFPERFITKDRILSSHQMPDIDLNIADQEPFIKAARKLCGEHGCYPLLAVGKLGEKSGFKLYAGINDIEPSVANEISKKIDEYNEAIKNAEDDAKDSIDIEDYIKDEHHLKIFNDSKPYQNIIEQAKVHACGFCIFNGNHKNTDIVGYGDLRYEIGLIRCVSESTGRSTVVLNVEGIYLDSYGYVKDDFLLVDVVSIIYKLYHALGREVPTVQELRKMVADDEETWKLYEMGATCCLNQCEKRGTRNKAMVYKPKDIAELSAFIAGIRPGFKSLINGFLNRINYSNGEKAIDDLLKDSFHYMLYQEAVMRIFSYLGIPMKDSYDTIKKISKKKLKGEALEKVESNLREHWLQNIGNTDNFEKVYNVVKDSARYSFNAPHAYSMANDSLYEAWVKAHYPSVFYEVTLNHYDQKGNKDKIAELEKEASQYFGYTIGNFRYGKDNSRFTVDDNDKTIYPSLGSVKGFGKKAVADLYNLYKKGYKNFVDIYLATGGSKINSTVFRNLIKIGYFSEFGDINLLLSICDLIDDWKGTGWGGKKTLKKSEAEAYGIPPEIVRKYGTDEIKSGISKTQYKISNWIGLVKELANKIEYTPCTLPEMIKYQMEILGYVEYRNPRVDSRYIIISDLNTEYSPRFKAIRLMDGKSCEMRISKKRYPRDKTIKNDYTTTPFENGDILFMKSFKKKPKQRKNPNVPGGWETVPNEYNWWITDYHKVKDIKV